MDIFHDGYLQLAVLNGTAQLASPLVSAISYQGGTGRSVVHLENGASDADVNAINLMLSTFDSLSPSVDLATIPADDVTEAVITLDIADTSIDWLILDSNDVIVGQGIEASVAGVVTLEFSTSVADVYSIWIIRKEDDFACGHVDVTVTEV